MDRRTRKTREALYSAFVSLVVERGFEAITVQQIIEAADIGRTTFYAHFKSKEQLLGFGFSRLRAELDGLLAATTPVPGRWSFVAPLLQHAAGHAGLYGALVEGRGGRLAEREFGAIVEEMVARELGNAPHRRTAVALLSGALSGAVRSVVETRDSTRIAEAASLFLTLADAVDVPPRP